MPNAQTTLQQCSRCQCARPPEALVSLSLGSGLLCRCCYVDLYINCTGCGATIAMDERRSVCQGCGPSSNIECNNCGESIQENQGRITPVGTVSCSDCFEDMYHRCHHCDCTMRIDDGGFCPDCEGRASWSNRGFFADTPAYKEIRSKRRFGIELETSKCPNHIKIHGDTIWGCVSEGSVDGMEFVSPVLYGDQGLQEVEKICEQASQLGWEIDSACGMHIHLDLSEETSENCFKLANAYGYTYDLWTSFISEVRKSNYYCAKHFYAPSDLYGYSDFGHWVEEFIGGDRYTWLNWAAYRRFKTVELRHHSATLNAPKIINWVKANARFIDKVLELSENELSHLLHGQNVFEQFNVISGWWDDSDLTDFYKERAAHFHKPFIKKSMLTIA